MSIVLEPEVVDQESTDESGCPNDSTHDFEPVEVCVVCKCCKWQIIRIVHEKFIICVDAAGRVQEFDR